MAGSTRAAGFGSLTMVSEWGCCCFPILSFLHVPGRMSEPLWLMMGTAFTFRAPEVIEAAPGQPATPQSLLLLTAKHTLTPWDYTKDASQLKIPKEYQKLRFVIGRVYQTDAHGRAVAKNATNARFVAHHPSLDVALLAVDVTSRAAQQCARVNSWGATLGLPNRTLSLCENLYPAGSDGLLIGYRGIGRLGELDTLDPSVLQRLSPHERDALLKDMQNVEGKQTQVTTTISILDPQGMCKGVGDLATCYHGMSGGPLLTTDGKCAGVLYGHHPDAPGCIGYTPCASFEDWLKEEVQRYTKRWCTVEQVTQLITVARLRSDVDEATRKSADLLFLDVCANAVNAGDVLIQVALESSASPGLRLNALLVAETLLTKKGWFEGAQFSDRSGVRQQLLHHVAVDPSPSLGDKVDAGLLRCLAMIVVLEFPTTEWQEWVRQCSARFAAGNARGNAVLCAVVAESHRNNCLWSFFANEVTAYLLGAQITTPPQQTAVMRLFLDLLRKRPRASVEHGVISATNCLLLSAALRQRVLEALLKRVDESDHLMEFTHGIFFSDCAVHFAVASRLVTDVESAAIVFRCSFVFLLRLRTAAVAGGGVVGAELRDFTEQLLECLLSTLQLYPDVAGANVTADSFLSCLIYFMIRPDELDWVDAKQLSAEFLEYFIDDEAVPLGCGSGDAASLAGAALELYLEHNSAQRLLAFVALNELLRATPVMNGPLTGAVALALRSVSRVYEESDVVAIDALEGAQLQTELLTHVSQLLLRTTHPHAHVMLIDALVHCFYRSQNQSLCTQLVELLQQLHMSKMKSTDEHGVCVRYACVYLAGRLVDELRSREWCGHLLSPEWIQLSLQQLCDGDAFGVFSAASTLCTLLSLIPTSADQLSGCLDMWDQGVTRLCQYATIRGVAGLLTLILKHISGLSFVSSSRASLSHNLQLAIRSCKVVLNFCYTPSDSRHLVLRSLVDFFIVYTRALLRGDAPPAVTNRDAEQLFSLAAALLNKDYALELAQDEPSCRRLANFAALYSVAFAAAPPFSETTTAGALVCVLVYAVRQRYASQTISCVCSRLALVLLAQPSQLDEITPQVLHVLFRDELDISNDCKGFNYGGVTFFVSLLLIRSPHALLQNAALSGGTGAASPAEPLRSLQRAFGWWLSLAPFMDAIQFLYFTAATCRIVDAVVRLTPEARVSLSGLRACRQYILPSPYVKGLPSRPLTGGHLLQHLAVAWMDLDSRHSRTSKPQLFEKELHPFLLSLDSAYEILCGQRFSTSTARDLIKTSTSETTAAVLEHMRGLGWSDLLVEGQQQVQAAHT